MASRQHRFFRFCREHYAFWRSPEVFGRALEYRGNLFRGRIVDAIDLEPERNQSPAAERSL